jgi:hypothetical protein
MIKSQTFVLVAALAVAAGCGKAKEPAGGGAASGTGKVNANAPAVDVVAEKLQAGIECLNRHSGRVFDARDTYYQRVPPDKQPEPGTEYSLLGLYPIDQCVTKLKAASALTPAAPELDPAALAYLAALEALVPIYEAHAGYYKKGEFRTDEGKGGIAGHAKLVAAFTAFATANRTYSDLVGAENRRRRVADLAEREKKGGRKLPVVLDSMMLEAETVIESLSSDAAALDLPGLEGKVTVYAKLVDEFAAYVGAHPDEAAAYGSRQNLINYSQSFLGKVRGILAALKDKKPVSGDEFQRASDDYNSIVDNYNRH